VIHFISRILSKKYGEEPVSAVVDRFYQRTNHMPEIWQQSQKLLFPVRVQQIFIQKQVSCADKYLQ